MTSPGEAPPPGPRPDASRSHGPESAPHGSSLSIAAWPGQATDAVVKAVDTVREKTTGPLQTAARGVVYGLISVVLGGMVLVLVIIGAIRLLDAVIPVGNVWLPYIIIGVVFLVAGYLVFRRRRTAEL